MRMKGLDVFFAFGWDRQIRSVLKSENAIG